MDVRASDLRFVANRLMAPYYIFVRARNRTPDAEFLRMLGLSDYRPTPTIPPCSPHACLADDGTWTMIADDWTYTVWHMPSTRPTLRALAQTCDVFACSVGDCDESFDFDYYEGGSLVRRYRVYDPDFKGGRLIEDDGAPLPGEAAAFMATNNLRIVLEIADSLGIRTDYRPEEIRRYAPVAPTPSTRIRAFLERP